MPKKKSTNKGATLNKVIIPYCITVNENERIEELFSEEMLQFFQKVKADRIALVFHFWTHYEKNVAVLKKAMAHFANYT